LFKFLRKLDSNPYHTLLSSFFFLITSLLLVDITKFNQLSSCIFFSITFNFSVFSFHKESYKSSVISSSEGILGAVIFIFDQ
jgi:hypothetical protein